jgi:hypothetical protein
MVLRCKNSVAIHKQASGCLSVIPAKRYHKYWKSGIVDSAKLLQCSVKPVVGAADWSFNPSGQPLRDRLNTRSLEAAQGVPYAQVAQLVEQRTENPRVGGSNPPLGTIIFKDLVRRRKLLNTAGGPLGVRQDGASGPEPNR